MAPSASKGQVLIEFIIICLGFLGLFAIIVSLLDHAEKRSRSLHFRPSHEVPYERSIPTHRQ